MQQSVCASLEDVQPLVPAAVEMIMHQVMDSEGLGHGLTCYAFLNSSSNLPAENFQLSGILSIVPAACALELHS